ncbi:hypothetical protein [Luteimonas yindakuii]|nr:hypothetical protein [Luteimonas yindakuii]
MSTLAGSVDDVAYPDRFHRGSRPALRVTTIASESAPSAIDRTYRWAA